MALSPYNTIKFGCANTWLMLIDISPYYGDEIMGFEFQFKGFRALYCYLNYDLISLKIAIKYLGPDYDLSWL